MKLNIIPQVFYDFIARLIPGTILIWSSFLVYYGYSLSIVLFKNNLGKAWNTYFILIIVTLFVAYIISIILSGIVIFITDKLGWSKFAFFISIKKNNTEWREIGLPKHTLNAMQILKTKYSSEENDLPSPSFIYDYLRLKAPNIGAMLVKLRAECHMCKVLIIGWSILIFLNLLNLKFLSFK
jgi:hypothetical protein